MRLHAERMHDIEAKRTPEKAANFAFTKWFNKLSNQQKIEFVPRDMQKEC